METLYVGFIGAGDVADLHAAAVRDLPGVVLKGLWDRDAENGRLKADKYGCHTYQSAEALLADEQIAIVFVLTNMETHAKYTIQAARAGKHVLVEKPAAASIGELEKMKEAVEEAGVRCIPGHNYIHEPGVERMQQMIRTGKLGTITQFYMLYNIEHAEEIRAKYPGVIRQILTHHAYTTLYLAGAPDLVSCFRSTINSTIAPQENVAMVNLKMKNGALSHLCASFANDDQAGDPWTCLIKVIGTQGSVRYSYRDWVINTRNGAHSQTFQAYPESIKHTATYFINGVIREGREPLSSLADAISCQRIIEACERSAAEGIHVKL